MSCDCGKRLRIDSAIAHKAARCKGCGRVYRLKSDGTYQIVNPDIVKGMTLKSGSEPGSLPAIATPSPVRLPTTVPIGQGAIDHVLGIGELTADPNDALHWFLEMARTAGILPTEVSRSAVDRVRQVWRVVKARTPEIDQEAAHAMDVAIDLLDQKTKES